MTDSRDAFSDPEAVARYAECTLRNVPAFEAMQRMAFLLLAENAPHDARVLVLGAGGGLETKFFADAHPGWTFDGVDSSAEMLALATRILGPQSARARLHLGTIDAAPEGPFDAACCLLTSHFIPRDERRRTVTEVRRRLRPGARFVTAQFSVPQGPGERALWLDRHAAFLVSTGLAPEQASSARNAIDARTHILTPDEDEAILRDGGFKDVGLFYAALAFRGWVATA